MKLLLSPDMILYYLSLSFKNNLSPRNKVEKFLIKLFLNENNKILLSHYYKKLLIDCINDINPKLSPLFQSIFVKWVDNKQVESLDYSFDEKNTLDEFLSLSKKSKKHGYHPCAIKPLSQKDVACVELMQKPNYHWITLNLASDYQLAVWPYDFQNDIEIKCFFDSILSYAKYKTKIYIQDDYCNIRQNNLFDIIANGPYELNYYLFSSDKCMNKNLHQSTLPHKKYDIKQKLGKKTKVFFTDKRKNRHPRRILFDNYIIKIDNDFASLSTRSSGWNIDVYYDPVTYSKIISDLSTYKELS